MLTATMPVHEPEVTLRASTSVTRVDGVPDGGELTARVQAALLEHAVFSESRGWTAPADGRSRFPNRSPSADHYYQQRLSWGCLRLLGRAIDHCLFHSSQTHIVRRCRRLDEGNTAGSDCRDILLQFDGLPLWQFKGWALQQQIKRAKIESTIG
jgi:hypothetical protein